MILRAREIPLVAAPARARRPRLWRRRHAVCEEIVERRAGRPGEDDARRAQLLDRAIPVTPEHGLVTARRAAHRGKLRHLEELQRLAELLEIDLRPFFQL